MLSEIHYLHWAAKYELLSDYNAKNIYEFISQYFKQYNNYFSN